MIIIKVMGGLGNQLQQYAIYKKFLINGIEAKLDISWFQADIQAKQLKERNMELNYLKNISYKVCTKEEKAVLIGNSNFWGKAMKRFFPNRYSYFAEDGRMYLPEIFNMENVYLEGYFACEKYYHDIMPLLQKSIIFPESGDIRNRELADCMKQEESVSLHIRRGDYLSPQNQQLFGDICTEAYYEEAIKRIKEQHPNAKFYLFSDDTTYTKEHYQGEEFSVIDWNQGENSFYDMYLMSCCKHNICANSTFSFWGARLNPNKEKMMIRPLKHRNNQTYIRDEMEKLWEGWILL